MGGGTSRTRDTTAFEKKAFSLPIPLPDLRGPLHHAGAGRCWLVLAGADERELGQEASTPPWPQAPSQEKVQQPRGPNLSDLLHEMVTRPRARDPGPREGPLRVLAEEQTSNAQIWGVGQAPGVAIYVLGSFGGAQI